MIKAEFPYPLYFVNTKDPSSLNAIMIINNQRLHVVKVNKNTVEDICGIKRNNYTEKDLMAIRRDFTPCTNKEYRKIILEFFDESINEFKQAEIDSTEINHSLLNNPI